MNMVRNGDGKREFEQGLASDGYRVDEFSSEDVEHELDDYSPGFSS